MTRVSMKHAGLIGADVAPGATATSGPQTITADVSGARTASLALPVTYKFLIDGVVVQTDRNSD